MTTIAEHLAHYAATLRYEDLPPPVVHQAKRMIVDTLGCALGGYESEPGRIAREMAGMVTSTQPATILCSGRQTSLDLAVFANGVMIRHLDFNDGYTGREAGHPSDSIAALLSAAEVGNASGRELITATVISYEVFCRMCDVLNIKPHGFDHVTIGAMASVAGAARLLSLTERQILAAINLTVAANVALYQTRIGDVSMWKSCAYANASRNAVFAAQLAGRGMNGPSPIFEGRGGYFKAVTRQSFELGRFGGDGEPFRIMDCLIKKFPMGQYAQSVVQAALEARSLVNVEEIAEVHVRTLETAVSMMAGDPEKWLPENRETADHSMPYSAGVALMYGSVDPRYFEAEHFRDPKLLDLVSRIRCSVSDEANAREPEAMLCDLEVVLRSGERKSVRVEYHRGHPRNPMSDEEIEEKFRSLAQPLLSEAWQDTLLDHLWRLDELPSIRPVLGATKLEGA